VGFTLFPLTAFDASYSKRSWKAVIGQKGCQQMAAVIASSVRKIATD